MKRLLILTTLATIAMMAGACVNKKSLSDDMTLPVELTNSTSESRWAKEGPNGENIDSLMNAFVPQIRPGEDLIGETYVDTLEYVEFDQNSDYWFIVARRPDGEAISIYYNFEPEFNRGDRVLVEWHVDMAWEAGDGDTPYLIERATNVTKLSDGPISKFRASHPDGLHYSHPNGWDPDENEERQARELYTTPSYYRAVEYYVANSRKPEIQSLAADPSAVIRYSVLENDDQDFFSRFDIWRGNGDGEIPEIIATFWIDTYEDSQFGTIYERDPATGELTKSLIY